MANNGRKYEEFVSNIQKALLAAEMISSLDNVEIELNKKIVDRSGIEREFDIYWEFELGGNKYKTVIECKDYASPISIEKIDAFLGKTSDIPGLKLIYATKTGYQSGAKIKAESHNIELLVIRNPDDSDWVAEDGTPLLREIHFNIRAIQTPRIISFAPMIDRAWFESQSYLTAEKINNEFSSFLNNQVFINDTVKLERYSIHELQTMLTTKIKDMPYGKGYYKEKLSNAFLEGPSLQVKIHGYSLDYVLNPPIEMTSVINFAEQIMGIVENFITGKRKWIMNDRTVK